jgi:hypothetical protein
MMVVKWICSDELEPGEGWRARAREISSPPFRDKNRHSVLGAEWSEETGFKLRRAHIISVDPGACTQLYGQPKPLCDTLVAK